MHSVRRFAAYSSLYAGASLAQKGAIMLLMLWLARVLSKEQYAAFGLLYAIQTGFTALAPAGIVEQVVARRHLDLNKAGDSAGAAFLANRLLMFQASGLALITILIMAAVPSDSPVSLGNAIWALAGGGVTALALIGAGLARLDHDHRASLILGAGVPALGTLGAWLAVIVQANSGAFFMGYALGAAIALTLAKRALINETVPPTAPLGDGLRQNLPYLVVGLMMWLSGYGNLWVIDQWFSRETVAQYTLAFTLASVVQIAANAMNQVWAPRHYDLIRTSPAHAVESSCRRYYLLLSLVVSGVAITVFLSLPLVLEYGGGNLSSYASIRHNLLWLFAGYALSIPWWHAQNLFVVHAAGDSLMKVLSWSTALGVFAWAIAMQFLGELGLYMGYALMMGVRSLAVWWIASRRWGAALHWEGATLTCLILLLFGALG